MGDLAQGNLEVVQAMAANGFIGRYDIVEQYLADDYVCRLPEGLPYGGTYRGLEGYKQVFAHIFDFFSEIDFGNPEFYPGDERVMIYTTITATIRATGRPITIPLAEAWSIRDGKVTEVVAFYYDTKHIHELNEG